MSRRILALLIIPVTVAAAIGCSFRGFPGLEPTATPTPTKTFVPTFTATPTIVPSPTETRVPTSTPEPPTPTQPPTATLGPPTSTPTPRPAAPTPTPKPPPPTKTPQPAYEFHYMSGPTKDPCHPGWCVPEISGVVNDAQGNPLDNFNRVWLKLESETFGVEFCATGDEVKALQPGHFKFGSPDGQLFRQYTLTIVRSPGDQTPLSAPLEEKMNSYTRGGQQTNIIFQRNY